MRALHHLGLEHGVARVGFDDVVPAPRLIGRGSGELPPAPGPAS